MPTRQPAPSRKAQTAGLCGGGARHEQARDAHRKSRYYLEDLGNECPVCLEPLHPWAVGGCGHPRHANVLLDCCRCNSYKGPDDHQLDGPQVRRRCDAVQGRLLRPAKRLHDGGPRAPPGTTRVAPADRTIGTHTVVTVLLGLAAATTSTASAASHSLVAALHLRRMPVGRKRRTSPALAAGRRTGAWSG